MDLKSVKALGGALGVGGTFGLVADVVVSGGEIAFWLLAFLVDQGGLLAVILARLAVVAPAVEWLPESKIQTAFLVVAAIVVVIGSYRFVNNFVRRWRSRNA